MSSQASGARAIAAEKPDLPFRIFGSMTRNTPSYSAARVTVIFPGSIPGELRPVGRGYAYDLLRTSGGNPDKTAALSSKQEIMRQLPLTQVDHGSVSYTHLDVYKRQH